MLLVAYTYLPAPRRQFNWRWLLIALFLLLIGARTIASTVIDYHWWKEMGQTPVWWSQLAFSVLPKAAAAALAFLVFWVAHSRGVKFGGHSPHAIPLYGWLSSLVLLVLAVLISGASIQSWVVVRYFGSRNLPAESTAWHDSVFGHPLSFYLFDLPFYRVIHGYLLAVCLLAALVYWLAARVWQLREQVKQLEQVGELDLSVLRLEGGLESRFLRGAGFVFLLALAVRFFLGRYELLSKNHGFMVGVDYVDLKLGLPLQWVLIAACVAAGLALLARRWRWMLIVVVALVLRAAIPPAVSAIYVRPNEIAIQRPYIERHIAATRAAFSLDRRAREVEYGATLADRIDPARYRPLLDNVRLWDWRAFHDTVAQIQALRPYYAFPDTDVDRYTIDGQLRQVLLSPRELDIRQLPDARTRWINPHFVYTHGYGMVMAEANRISTDGLPHLFVQDAPPQLRTKSLRLTRPEIYYGEITHEPVFVRTGQEEFSYPSGNESVFTRYDGTGGIPISSFALRLAAAVSQADANILLTSLITPESRMMIRRRVLERIGALAEFIHWDSDPYLVLSEEGRLVWTVDGFTTSDAHPYSQAVPLQNLGPVNYMRNAVKATVDAYSGATRIYIFDPSDPIIRAYQNLFPTLFHPAAAMPVDLRRHARYPEALFRVQAEIYRTYHMRDPQAFYNKEDVWDVARNIYGQDSRPTQLTPTYVVATVPGEDTPEFLLLLPFTPRNKDNMIGLMVARCDGESLGELLFLQLSKQELIFGPMQIEARINQDQNISKDLTLWNQQGSQVLRGQILVLPAGKTFLYVEPIYIQASEARMPQLKKVVLAVGNDLVYRDTYDEAIQALTQLQPGSPLSMPPPAAVPAAGAPAAAAPPPADRRLDTIRQHLRRYRDLSSQGKWAEAGRELEAIERLAAQQ